MLETSQGNLRIQPLLGYALTLAQPCPLDDALMQP